MHLYANSVNPDQTLRFAACYLSNTICHLGYNCSTISIGEGNHRFYGLKFCFTATRKRSRKT